MGLTDATFLLAATEQLIDVTEHQAHSQKARQFISYVVELK